VAGSAAHSVIAFIRWSAPVVGQARAIELVPRNVVEVPAHRLEGLDSRGRAFVPGVGPAIVRGTSPLTSADAVAEPSAREATTRPSGRHLVRRASSGAVDRGARGRDEDDARKRLAHAAGHLAAGPTAAPSRDLAPQRREPVARLAAPETPPRTTARRCGPCARAPRGARPRAASAARAKCMGAFRHQQRLHHQEAEAVLLVGKRRQQTRGMTAGAGTR
jgi:hypothetical protein